MKKITLLAAVSIFTTAAFAQKYDEIKTFLTINNIKGAKELYDKQSTNEKFFAKPEGYIIKSALYSNFSLDSTKAADAAKNMEEAYTAFNKFKELDPSMKLLEDPIYKNAPYYVYAAYYNNAVKDLNDKKYNESFDKFSKTVEMSDILIAKKINLLGPIDTNANYYAGALAEQINNAEAMVKYNSRLADLKVTGENYISVYQSLVRHFAVKNDDANFNKYIGIGKELFPKSEFFTYTKLDFAVGVAKDFTEKLGNLEKVLASNPEDYKNQLTYAEVIFDTLNTRKEGAVRPANAEELEAKMLPALIKANSLKPTELQPLLLLGDHFMNKSGSYRDAQTEAQTEVDKKGAKATADEKKKVSDLKAKYTEAYDVAAGYFEKTLPIYEAKGANLDRQTKNQYKTVAGILADYYSLKREGAKGADFNKFVALETKFNNLYDKLRK